MMEHKYNTAPSFRNRAAAEIQSWFSRKDPSFGVAVEAYRGRGVYEGMIVYQEAGADCYPDIEIDLEHDSLDEYLKQVEQQRHVETMEGEPQTAELINMEAVVNYVDVGKHKNDIASPVLSDIPHLKELNDVMIQNYIRPQWFAWIDVKDGKTENLVSAENQDLQAPAEVLDAAQKLYDALDEKFASFVVKAGYQKTGGILLSSAEPGYDFSAFRYKDVPKAVYDDRHNVVIIQSRQDL